MVRMAFFQRNTSLNLAIRASDIAAAMAGAGSLPLADCETDHGLVLVHFVRALAKRQARLDVELAYCSATGNEPRTLH